MKKIIIFSMFIVLWANISFSQIYPFNNTILQGQKPAAKSTVAGKKLTTDLILKKPGHYSTEDWHALIDSCWGPGVPTAEKLAFFDDFWNTIDQSWGGFPNLYVNWDSLRSVYRPLIEAGVSRGRFAGILSSLTQTLQEPNTGAFDDGIYDDQTKENFNYIPGLPVINLYGFLFETYFGAGLTLLPDSNIMVYSVMPNHPLDLQPGDIIIGYDGIPWKKQLNDLLKAELPILNFYYGNPLGSSTAAANHNAMITVGKNWGLFDTIDIVKYSTNDTLHQPTSLLAAITPPYLIATQQIPVKGIQFPDIRSGNRVSWGIVDGTNIGYIYVWGWLNSLTIQAFGKAVDELVHIHKVSGLVLDFRTNLGGGHPSFANEGFKYLFNTDPTSNYSAAKRTPGDDHYAFNTISSAPYGEQFTPNSELFEHPIAVLLGPSCLDGGDYNAFRLRFHPMARSFGKPTNGSFIAYEIFDGYEYTDPYGFSLSFGSLYSDFNNEGFMIHKGCPVDQEVWLTRDGVAKGEDNVVISALEWIQNLSHAYDVTVQPVYAGLENTEITLTAKVENPNNHDLSVYAKITDLDKVPLDSSLLFDDGGHGDGDAGDGIWGVNWPLPSGEKTYVVNMTTEDTTAGSLRELKSVVRFTTVGPVVFEEVSYTGSDIIPNPGDNFDFKITLRNNGLSASAIKIRSILTSLDTLAFIPENFKDRSFVDIEPGELSTNATNYRLVISKDCPVNKEIPVKVDITSDNYTFWSDTFSIMVSGPVGTEKIMEPIIRLYPNPTENVLNIELNNAVSQILEIEILTVTGEVIYHKGYRNTAAHFVEQVDLSGYTKGIYLVKVIQDKTVTMGKVVVR